jgi:hypothetical protein
VFVQTGAITPLGVQLNPERRIRDHHFNQVVIDDKGHGPNPSVRASLGGVLIAEGQ